MNRLRLPGDSDYDVLGVSPEASDEEINRAFHRLIDGQGYKVGVPLNRQWLRAHQIKTAHANLTDPAKRRAQDETLSRASGPALWAAPANDQATDELVLPAQEAPVENRSAPEAAVPPQPGELPLGGSEPDLAQEEPDPEEEVGSIQNEPPYAAEPASAKRWGVAAAVVSGLGLVLVATWSGWNDRSPTREVTPEATANAGEPALIAGNFEGSAAADSGKRMASSDSPAASAAPGRAIERQPASDQSDAPQNMIAASASPAAAAATSAPIPAAEVQAPAPAPPPTDLESVVPTATANAEGAARPLQRPARWLGGGPTDADNRRGRYHGTVAVQVNVEPDGRVSNCAAVQGSGDAALDALTCRLVRERARFAPALDTRGRPVVSQAYTTFVWGRRPQ
jgi:protein TonB